MKYMKILAICFNLAIPLIIMITHGFTITLAMIAASSLLSAYYSILTINKWQKKFQYRPAKPLFIIGWSIGLLSAAAALAVGLSIHLAICVGLISSCHALQVVIMYGLKDLSIALVCMVHNKKKDINFQKKQLVQKSQLIIKIGQFIALLTVIITGALMAQLNMPILTTVIIPVIYTAMIAVAFFQLSSTSIWHTQSTIVSLISSLASAICFTCLSWLLGSQAPWIILAGCYGFTITMISSGSFTYCIQLYAILKDTSSPLTLNHTLPIHLTYSSISALAGGCVYLLGYSVPISLLASSIGWFAGSSLITTITFPSLIYFLDQDHKPAKCSLTKSQDTKIHSATVNKNISTIYGEAHTSSMKMATNT
ncbi:hypothetical protein N9Y17_01700 [Gammaproteobacteria bacterium]|nr:hypothetical protein [Gammaproteobacteria bacterium]